MQLLHIRYLQAKHELKNLGAYTLVLVTMYVFALFVAYTLFATSTLYALFLSAALVAVCMALQATRTDKQFVKTHITQPHLQFFTDYVIITLPFALMSLLTRQWYVFPAIIASIALVPFINITIKYKTYFKNISVLLPHSNFEWISGFRKSFTTFIPLYITAIALSPFRIAPLVCLFLLSISISSLYAECEPLQILQTNNYSAKRFLINKLCTHALQLLLVLALPLIINALCNPYYWIVNVFFALTQVSLLCVAINLKYTFYAPNKNISASNVILSVLAVGCILPFLLPIPAIMGLNYYKKAKQNLTNYLHD
jgi:hypothetical protein